MAQIIKNSVIYTLGTILRQTVSFIMLPIYTNHLSPANYGAVEMMSVITAVLSLIAGVQIGQSTFRFYYEQVSETAKNKLLASAFITTFLLGALVYIFLFTICLTGAGAKISNFVFGEPNQINLLLTFCLVVILQPVEEQLFILLRIKDWAWKTVSLSTAKLIIQLSLNIYFIAYLNLGTQGVVYSAVLSTGFTALLSFGVVIFYTGLNPTIAHCIQLMKFALPLTIGSAGYLYMSLSDRYVLKFFQTNEAVGLYALGYRLADLLTVLGWTPFMTVWQTRRFEIAKQPDFLDVNRHVFWGLMIYVLWMALGIALLSDNVLRILTKAEFWPAANVVPPMLAYSMFTAIASFCMFPYLISDAGKWIARSFWFSAALMTGMYFLLVPFWGELGTAWSKAIATAGQSVFLVYFARKIYPLGINWLRLIVLMTVCVAEFNVCNYFSSGDLILETVIDLAFIFVFPALALKLPILPKSDRAWLSNEIQTQAINIRNRFRASAT